MTVSHPRTSAPPTRVAVAWSGGKDAAHALSRLLDDPRYEVVALVTTVHGPRLTATVHEIGSTLLRAQASAIGLPWFPVRVTDPHLRDHAEALARTAVRLREAGVEALAYGDLDAMDVRPHRAHLLSGTGLSLVTPLAGLSSPACMEAFGRTGITAHTVVVDAAVLGPEYLGRRLDDAFVTSLPQGCDPAGEFGEYHSFVSDAPFFDHPVPFTPGRVTTLSRRIGTLDGPATFTYWRLQIDGPLPHR